MDMRWVGARAAAGGHGRAVCGLGPDGQPAGRAAAAGARADRASAGTDRSPALLIDILYSRVSHAPGWGGQARALTIQPQAC